jgi:NADPH-dependent 2,4-dienoyl-CoA reductase/sulfur reductase-like enzyme
MVIGGGIAGMEAARVAALRGHKVVLYEREPALGGQLQIAAKAPGRQDFAEPVRWYEKQFSLLGVEVHLNAAVDLNLITSEAPDAVILATGGTPAVPEIPGVDSPHVVQARDVLMGKVDTGDQVVVLAADQGMEGLTTADFLATRGKKVWLVIPQIQPGAKVEAITCMMILSRLARQSVQILTMTRIDSIEARGVRLANVFGGPEQWLDGIDTVVLAAGSRANDGLAQALRERVKDVILAGECLAPRKLEHSSLDGLKAGLAV